MLSTANHSYDTVLVHNDPASISLVDSVSPTLILATLFMLSGLVSAFLAANLHVNCSKSDEYPMFFMPSWINSNWGVAIGLLIVFGIVVMVWRPFDDNDEHSHHHDSDGNYDHAHLARRHGLVHAHHTHETHNHHRNGHASDASDDENDTNWAMWIIVFLLLSIVSAVVFCSPMRRWYGARMSIDQHYSTANFVKYGVTVFIVVVSVWIVADILGHATVQSVSVTSGSSVNTLWTRSPSVHLNFHDSSR